MSHWLSVKSDGYCWLFTTAAYTTVWPPAFTFQTASKGQRLGIFQPGEEKGEKARERPQDQTFYVELMGRAVPAVNTAQGIRAANKGSPDDPQSVMRYLEKKFGPALPEARAAMEELAAAMPPAELARRAYALYERFRPDVPEGTRGWGAQGDLDLDGIRSMVSSG